MSNVLLCLHGWGGSKESFTELREALSGTNIEIFTPDLPGFGTEPEPREAWNTDQYVDWVEQWMQNNIPDVRNPNTKVHLLGHSHGGRIAIKLAARGNIKIDHLYLCAAAGIRHSRHFKRIIGLTLAKVGRVLLSIPGLKLLQPIGRKLLYRLVRVHDYEQASPVMQQTMIKVSAEDLRPILPKVTVPTDIFWGTDDGMTPVTDAHTLHAGISGSQLHLYPGIRHRVHRDKAVDIAAIINEKCVSH